FAKYRQLYSDKKLDDADTQGYAWCEDNSGSRRRATKEELTGQLRDVRIFTASDLTSQTVREAQTTVFPVSFEGQTYSPRKGGWKTNQTGMGRLKLAHRLIAVGNS